MLQLKDVIYNFRQLHSEALYKACLSFMKMLMNVSNYKIIGGNLLEIFYVVYYANTNILVDTNTSKAFMSLQWD